MKFRFSPFLLTLWLFALSASATPTPAEQFDFLLSQVRSCNSSMTGGKAYFYDAGSTTLKPVCLDPHCATRAANPYTLDGNGMAPLYGRGLYRVVIKDAGGICFERDNVAIGGDASYLNVDDYPTVTQADVAATTSGKELRLNSSITLSASTTLGATVKISPGVIITVPNGITLTINSPFNNGLNWCFRCTGTGKVLFTSVTEVFPEWWGAKADWNGVVGTNSSSALSAAAATGQPVRFAKGAYYFTYPVTFHSSSTTNSMFTGAGMSNTQLIYRGPAGTHAFEAAIDTATNPGDANWPGRAVFSDFSINGVGTGGNLGRDATTGGIYAANTNSSQLVNIPHYSFNRVRLYGLTVGVQVEGYGHIFTDCIAEACGIGYEITHPEQVSLNGCWANYCGIGLQSNIRKAHFGHTFIIQGGAYQRCNIGIQLGNVLEATINTYFELNNVSDIVLGNPSSPRGYEYSTKNVTIAGNFNSSSGIGPNIDCYSTVGAKIAFHSFGSTKSNAPLVRTSGWSKYIDVEYNPEELPKGNVEPFDFRNESALTSIARQQGSGEKSKIPTLASPYSASDPLLVYYKTQRDMVRVQGSVISGAGGSSQIFVLPAAYKPAYTQTFPCVYYKAGWHSTFVQIKADTLEVYWNEAVSGATLYITADFRTYASGVN